MKRYKLTLLSVMLFLLSGCGYILQNQTINPEDNNLDIEELTFDSLHKTFYADIDFSPNLSALILKRDTSLRIDVREFTEMTKVNPKTQPQLIKIENIRKQQLRSAQLNVLALIDLSLEQTVIDHQKEMLLDFMEVMPENSIQIAFFKGKKMTETMELSEYILNTYFHQADTTKYFYQGLLTKLEEFAKEDSTESITKQNNNDSILTSNIPDEKVVMILSDGKVYDEDSNPIDPKHFSLQRSLVKLVDSTKDLPIYYFNLREQLTKAEMQGDDSDDLLRLICQKSGGRYINTGKDNILIYNLLDNFKENFCNYRFKFQNPDGKIYRGDEHLLEVSYFQNDSLIGSDHFDYYLGSVYNPVVVNGRTTAQIVLRGTMLGLIIIFFIYVILQYIVPFVEYLLFKRKFVTRYTGKNMCFNNILVKEECHFCKAPFEEGDEIVVKCEHAVHRDCWEENGYQCPEYGMNCKQGKHYYNQHQLYDPHNAPYYFTWIMAGAFAALVSWILFTSQAHNAPGIVFAKVIPTVFNVDPDSAQAAVLMNRYGSHLLYLPFYGLNMGLCLTFALSLLTGHGKWWWRRVAVVIGKAFLGGFFSCLSFIIGSVISIALDFTDNSFLVDWIPWLLSGCFITLILAFGTEIKLKKALIGALVSVVLGLGSTYLWANPADTQFDTRVTLLIGYLVYTVGFAFSIAYTYPKSERYFLRVEGPIKEMDIALFKWMNAHLLNKEVFIGKSVDCELQMTWDITSQISPKQARVYMRNGNLYMEALDGGVYYRNKEMDEGDTIRLYHGTKFTIGKTIFTYLEKDI